MKKNEVLDLEIRRKIYNHILKSPGLHEREISRTLNIPLSTLDYHLFHLKKRDLVQARTDGRYTRYYTIGDIGIKDKKAIAILRQSGPRKIVMFLLLNPDSYHRAIHNHLKLAPSTTSFHLKKLVNLDIINRIPAGRETTYHIKEPEYISDLLITFRKSFLDKAVDQFLDTWFELNPKYIRKQRNKKN